MLAKRKRAIRDSFDKLAKLGGIGLPKPKSVSKPKAKIPEKDIQSMAENLCLSLGIRFFRIPDSLLAWLKMSVGTPMWVKVFISRYFVGVPDLMLFKRLETGDNLVRFIEIKTEAGALTQGQKSWHRGLNIHVCYGWDETKKAIEDFDQ
jgi:hypothetical protein